MKTRLKGGLIAVGVFVFLRLIYYIIRPSSSIFSFSINTGNAIFDLVILSLLFPTWLISFLSVDSGYYLFHFIFIFITSMILYFLVGSLIGFIIEKIKLRNSRRK